MNSFRIVTQLNKLKNIYFWVLHLVWGVNWIKFSKISKKKGNKNQKSFFYRYQIEHSYLLFCIKKRILLNSSKPESLEGLQYEIFEVCLKLIYMRFNWNNQMNTIKPIKPNWKYFVYKLQRKKWKINIEIKFIYRVKF